MSENGKVDINKHEVDIDILKKQNVNDLLSIKELYRRLEEIQEKIDQIKYIDSTLAKRLKKDYENLKKVILDENVTVALDNKIDASKKELNQKIETNRTEVNNKITEFNEQLATIAPENFVVATPSTISELLKTHKKIKLSDETFTMDIILPKNVEIVGCGQNTHINGMLKINSNCKVSNMKLGGDNKSVLFENNTTNVTIYNCIITKGLTSLEDGGAIYANDIHLSNVYITNCTFTKCNSNGIKFVEKSSNGNIQNIYIENCKFFDNVRMNFEIIGRSSEGANRVGYKNVNIKGCYFHKEDNTKVINVSYDGNYYIDGDEKIYTCGYSTIENCIFENGNYCLEMAGASHMKIINNKIIGGTDSAISTSSLIGFDNSTEFRNNTVISEKQSVFAGNNCIIEGNKFIDSNIILNKGSNTEIKNNNILISICPDESLALLKAVQVRSSKECRIIENTIDFRGSNIVNINFIALQYEDTIDTLIRGNNFYRPPNILGGNNIEYDTGCIKSKNRVMNNYINDNFSENGETLILTKTLTSTISTTTKEIVKLTPSLAEKGNPETIVEIEGVCRKGNTTKFISAKVYFCNYNIPNATPIIIQSEDSSHYDIEAIAKLVDDKYSYTIKIKDEYAFDSGMKKVIITQYIPNNIETNNYFIIN